MHEMALIDRLAEACKNRIAQNVFALRAQVSGLVRQARKNFNANAASAFFTESVCTRICVENIVHIFQSLMIACIHALWAVEPLAERRFKGFVILVRALIFFKNAGVGL